MLQVVRTAGARQAARRFVRGRRLEDAVRLNVRVVLTALLGRLAVQTRLDQVAVVVLQVVQIIVAEHLLIVVRRVRLGYITRAVQRVVQRFAHRVIGDLIGYDVVVQRIAIRVLAVFECSDL